MAENIGAIRYTVDADTSRMLDAVRRVNSGLSSMQGEMQRTDRQAGVLAASFNRLAVAIGAVISVNAIKNTLSMTENMTLLEARVTRLSGSAGKGADNFHALMAIAAQTGIPMRETVKTWESLTASLEGMGRSNKEILQFTETVQKMARISGASTEEAKNGLRQLGQALASGVLRGDELNSVMENMPEIARQLAKNFKDAGGDIGVAFGDIRRMAERGELTTEKIMDAMARAAATTAAEFDKLPRMASYAMTAAANSFSFLLAKMDQAAGFSQALARAFDFVSEAMFEFAINGDSVNNAIKLMQVAGVSLAALIAGKVVTAFKSSMTAAAQANAVNANLAASTSLVTQALIAKTRAEEASALSALRLAEGNYAAVRGTQFQTAALNALIAAQARYKLAVDAAIAAGARQITIMNMMTAAASRLRAAMAFLGGPLGVIMLAATALVYFRDEARETAESIDGLSKGIDKLNTKQMKRLELQNVDRIAEAREEIAKLKKEGLPRMDKIQLGLELESKGITGQEKEARINAELEARVEILDEEIKARQNLASTIAKEQAARKKANEEATKTVTGTPHGKQNIKDLEDELKVAKARGVEEAKIKALQKAGPGITDEEKARIENLAAQIYYLNEAKKKTKEGGDQIDKQIQSLKDRLVLANKTGIAFEREKAALDLGVKATQKQRDLAADYAEQVARAEASKEAEETITEMARSFSNAASEANATREIMAAMANIKIGAFDPFSDQSRITVGDDLAVAITNAEELEIKLYELAEVAKLPKITQLMDTEEAKQQVETVRSLARETKKLEIQQRNLASLNQIDPMAAAKSTLQQQLADLETLRHAENTATGEKFITEQRYLELKKAAEIAYNQEMMALEEERFRQQSWHNDMLMSALDALGENGGQAIAGMITGTNDLQSSMRSLFASILGEGINSVIKLGVEHVKSIVMAQQAETAATAASVANQATVATTGAATAATLATAFTPAAIAASIATLGGAAIAGLAAITSVTGKAGSIFGGGKLYGGNVDPSKMYRINENGAPEIFNAANGQQYMMPNQRGEVVSNKDAMQGQSSSSQGNISVNLIEDRSRAGQVTSQQIDDQRVIEIVVSNIYGGGQIRQAQSDVFGVKAVGR